MEQKLNKLQKYVKRYPAGWKKRLQLANVLLAMGHIEQAVEQHEDVLVKRKDSTEGYLQKLAQLLQDSHLSLTQ